MTGHEVRSVHRCNHSFDTLGLRGDVYSGTPFGLLGLKFRVFLDIRESPSYE